MGARRQGRILAFQALYAWGAAGTRQRRAELLPGLLEFSWLDDGKKKNLVESADFSRLLVQGTVEKITPVDKMIKQHLKNWDFSRLNLVDLSLLRMSVYGLMFQDTPPSVVIDEAVCISREFGTDDSYRFINGVLDSVRRTIQDGAKE
ncbi:MAG: transcription antitermination factor NusB [Treponema sp.]|jgi:N utilization substance protein B|nr:transcription antitermination factor NusB [Treponema sp.]